METGNKTVVRRHGNGEAPIIVPETLAILIIASMNSFWKLLPSSQSVSASIYFITEAFDGERPVMYYSLNMPILRRPSSPRHPLFHCTMGDNGSRENGDRHMTPKSSPSYQFADMHE